MSDIVKSGSHIPVLIQSLLNTTGPVLEMGMGFNSTPLLHWLCKDLERDLYSMESDLEWMHKFDGYQSLNHIIMPIPDWNNTLIGEMNWGLVLIDHKPGIQRGFDAVKVADRAQIVVLHDSEPEWDKIYGYSKVYDFYKYRHDDTRWKPCTTVLSNTIDVKELLA